ncbi:MAG: hypothetical protein WA324_26205 [Bryobacteraceae bacterium]
MVSAEDLRRAATARFLNTALGQGSDDAKRRWAVLELVVDIAGFEGIESFAVRSVGEFIESKAWWSLGARIGYFDRPQPITDTEISILGKAAQLSEISRWPPWFKGAANSLFEEKAINASVWPELPSDDPETLALFQSALLLGEELRDPLIEGLEFLLVHGTILDQDSIPTDSRAIMHQFEHFNEAVERSGPFPMMTSLSQSVAGLFRLMEVMASFDNVFLDDLEDDSVGFPLDGRRSAISRATANAMSWQLNLSDERVVGRLGRVGKAFWDVCEAECRTRLASDESWSSQEARSAVVGMFKRGRARCDAVHGVEKIDLDVIAGRESLLSNLVDT